MAHFTRCVDEGHESKLAFHCAKMCWIKKPRVQFSIKHLILGDNKSPAPFIFLLDFLARFLLVWHVCWGQQSIAYLRLWSFNRPPTIDSNSSFVRTTENTLKLYTHFRRPRIQQNKHIPGVVQVRVKVKFTLEQATEAQRGSRGIALLFLQPRR